VGKLKAECTRAEESFWQDKEQYERNLKEGNRRAYNPPYIQEKKDAYAERHYHCDGYHFHSDSFYHQT
jgi:hypothetical protein